MKVPVKIKVFLGLAVPMLFLAAGGCAGEEESRAGAEEASIVGKKVVIDKSLRDSLAARSVNSSVLENGLLMAQVTVENVEGGVFIFSSRQPLKFAFAFTWLDSSGQEVCGDTEEAWIKKEISHRDTIRLTAVAPSPECRDFVLKIKKL